MQRKNQEVSYHGFLPTTWVGNLQLAKQTHLTRSSFTNCSNDTARLVVGYFVLLIYLPCNYLAMYTYEKLSYQKSNLWTGVKL